MYSNIETITINEKKYYVYKKVLEEYHYFDTILQGKFQEKSIHLDFDITPDFNNIINCMMTYYYTKKYFDKPNFSEFIELCSLLTYLQPKDTNMITFLIETYNYSDELDNYHNKINIINNSILGQNHKIIILNNIIKKLNKINLLYDENDEGRSNIDVVDNGDDRKYILKIPFIYDFFKQFDIHVDNYEALIEIRGSDRDCWGMPNGPGMDWDSDSSDDEQVDENNDENNDHDKNNDLDKNLVWFEGGSRGYYQDDYAIKEFKINNHVVELINIKENRDTINFLDTLTNFISTKYLLQ